MSYGINQHSENQVCTHMAVLRVYSAGRLKALCNTDRPVRLRRRLGRLPASIGGLPNGAGVALSLAGVNYGTCVAKV